MRRGIIFGITAFVLSSFFVAAISWAASTDIVINEIGGYPTSTHEWIEIWNKGVDPVDMTGWKFWEGGVNHSIATGTTGNTISPGEYAVIVQDAAQFLLDYPSFPWSVFDSAWSSLSGNGEEIGLKDNVGNFVEQFTYPAFTNFSLERRDAALQDYTSANWQEHANGNSVGNANSNLVHTQTTSTPTTTTTPEEPPEEPTGPTSTPPTEETPTTPTTSPETLWSYIKINEIFPIPDSGNEWIELYNTTSTEVNLSGLTLCDNRTSAPCTIASPTGTIATSSWFVVALPTARLNNDGDSVILKDPNGIEIDRVDYSDGLVPDTNQALARSSDGKDTDTASDWSITTEPTQGSANIVRTPPPPTPRNSGIGGSNESIASPVTYQLQPNSPLPDFTTSTTPLIITSLFPDPEGSDTETEFIELYNRSSHTIELNGWKIADSAKSHTLTGTLTPGTRHTLSRSTTGISLNNTSAETVRLTSPGGSPVDSVSYSVAEEDMLYKRMENNEWKWEMVSEPTTTSTSQQTASTTIVWNIASPLHGSVGETITLDASASRDPRGGRIQYLWNTDDGTRYAGDLFKHVFATSGPHSITVTASSTQGTVGTKTIRLAITKTNTLSSSSVMITEALVNPDGDDTQEFVELYNTGTSSVALAGWTISGNGSKTFTIPVETIIAPGEFLVFYRPVTTLTLNNTSDVVTLTDDQDSIIDIASWKKSIAGASYTRWNKTWIWSAPTPGAPSNGTVLGEKITKSSSDSPRISILQSVSFEEARTLPKDTPVAISGIVTALPGTLGSQYFYISGAEGGIQIYQAKKNFPPLKIGTPVAVAGMISSGSGTPRVNVKSSADIAVSGPLITLKPRTLSLADIDEKYLGSLIQINGEVTSLKGSSVYIDDGESEFEVYLKSGAKIDKKQLKLGNRVSIAGILEKSKDSWQLWPRGNEDIAPLAEEVATTTQKASEKKHDPKSSSKKYFIVLALGLIAFFGIGITKQLLKNKNPA